MGTGPTEEEGSAYMAATETSKQRQQARSPEKRILVSAASRDKTNARQGVRRLLEELLRIRWESWGIWPVRNHLRVRGCVKKSSLHPRIP